MANILRQTVFQINVETEKRIIVQYINESGDDVQTINNYDNLTENEKLIFDSFYQLSESKMI
jgi:hypothetical protein